MARIIVNYVEYIARYNNTSMSLHKIHTIFDRISGIPNELKDTRQ